MQIESIANQYSGTTRGSRYNLDIYFLPVNGQNRPLFNLCTYGSWLCDIS